MKNPIKITIINEVTGTISERITSPLNVPSVLESIKLKGLRDHHSIIIEPLNLEHQCTTS